MDPPKLENKNYKKVVPLKGRLLDKLKNEFKKELSKNDSKAAGNGVSDTLTTNIQTNEVPAVQAPQESPEKKVIIQKVENVHIDVIQTTSYGSRRRVSSFFEPEVKFEEVDMIHTSKTKEVPKSNDAIFPEIERSVENGHKSPRPQTTVKILSANIPANVFNKKVPLKMVRTIKMPKPKPNLSQRYHRVETFKAPETKIVEEAFDFTQNDIKVAALVPEIEMKEDQSIEGSVAPIETTLQPKDYSSESEEDFNGFDKASIEGDFSIQRNLKTWHRVLKTNLNDKLVPVSTRIGKELNIKEAENSNQKELPAQDLAQHPSLPELSINFSDNQFEIKIENVSMKVDSPKAVKEILIPSTSKNLKNNEAKYPSNRFGWQDDILVVIGATRIKEIDEMLKKIPNIVTGNVIETENVELRLIIRHLLRKFKLQSIMDTLRSNSVMDLAEESSNNDDDDFPDSFDDDSNGPDNFFDPTTEDSVDMNEDDKRKDASNDSNVAGPSNSSAVISDTRVFKVAQDQTLETLGALEAPVQIEQKSDNKVDLMESSTSFTPIDEDLSEASAEQVDKSDPVIPVMPMVTRKRKMTEIPSSSSFEEKKTKTMRSSSSGSATEVSKTPAVQKLTEEPAVSKPRSRKHLIDGTERRNSLRSSSCESGSEGKKLSAQLSASQDEIYDHSSDVKLKNGGSSSTDVIRRLTKVQELKDSESDSGPSNVRRKSSRIQLIKPSTDDSDIDQLQVNNPSGSDDSMTPLAAIPRTINASSNKRIDRKKRQTPLKNNKKKTTSKVLDSSSDSEFSTNDISRNLELKSRLNPVDSNSKHKSSIFARNNYLKSTDTKKKKPTEVSLMMDKLSTTIEERKNNDKTYFEPPVFEKRERLRTSAFKGNNNECSNDKDIQIDSESDVRPSVSRGSSVEKSPPKISSEFPSEKRRGRRAKCIDELSVVKKKIFTQPPLEDAVEDQVPYREILEAIKYCVPAKVGRVNSKSKLTKEYEEKREKDLQALKALKFFRCGSCKFEITKHMWIDHLNEHGGMAWIDSFEAPIIIEEWNEALRRLLKNVKIYDQPVLTCPNCEEQKKSALGHLSHILVCGESKEAVEKKKILCELCNEKYLPFYASLHRSKCSGYQKVQEVRDGDDEGGSSDSEVVPESFNSSGRAKRKAVKRAEKKFKKINTFKPSDHLRVKKGQLNCTICGKESFQSQQEALEHIKQEHDKDESGDDYESSDSDVEMHDDESTDETEGSSGDDSSDMKSSEDESLTDNDESSQIVYSKKAKPSATEPQEVKNARVVIIPYLEELRCSNLNTVTSTWTQQFVDDNWRNEILPQLLPKYTLNSALDPKVALPPLNFNLKSMKFGKRTVEKYSSTYENKYNKEWKQLKIGEHESDKTSATIYCGGSVSAVDWAAVDGDIDFLAVATNSTSRGIKSNLNESSKSCLHLYEFKNLTNDKFQGFDESSKLCYVIIINDGPIWSIKFHPSVSQIENRVGLLAVATANQNILVYSMPYLNNDKPIVLQIEPSLICKLEEGDVLFNDEFLLQASRVAWFQKYDSGCFLAAGYVSGIVGVWNISSHDCTNDELNQTVYPNHVIQAHLESITALDFKATTGPEFHLLTASLDRKLKVFTFDNVTYEEIANHYSVSRVLYAEWWMNWPGFLIGFDDSFTASSFIYRQPLEFAIRNSPLLNMNSSITHLSINNWHNSVMFVTDSGDVVGCGSRHMLQHNHKDKWTYFNFSVYSTTDFNKINTGDIEEIGLVFEDFKSKTPQPKKQRIPPTEHINELQINQVCFNRNEKSYRFYALGYETGFVRINYLKNLK